MAKIRTTPRRWLVFEAKLDGSSIDTNDGTKATLTATNVTYANTDVGYQKQCGVFNGSSSSVTYPSTLNGILSLAFKIYPTANTKTIVSFTGWSVTITSGNALSSSGLTSPSYYVNGVLSTSLTLNAWNDCVITFSSANLASFNFGASSFVGYAQDVRTYDRAIKDTEIRSLNLEKNRKLGGEWYVGILDGLVAMYDMKGDAKDVIGGNDGTVIGATLTTDRFGVADSAYSFSGSSQYIDLPTAWVPTGNSDRTMMAWVDGTKNDNTVIYNIGGYTTDNNMGISIHTNGQLKAYVYGRSDLLSWIDKAGLHLVGLTLVWTTLSVYVDGEFCASGTYSSINITAENHRIGSLWGTYYAWIVGEVLHCSEGYSANRMKAVYKAMKQKKIYPFTKSLPTNIQRGMLMDIQNSYDQSGNGKNGTDANSPTAIRRFTTTGRRYNGSNQSTSYPTLSKTAYTWAVWLKPNGVPTGSNKDVLTMENAAWTNVYAWYGHDSSNASYRNAHGVFNGSSLFSAQLLSNLPTDRVTLVMGTYDGQTNGEIAIYRNSGKESSTNITGTVATTYGGHIGGFPTSSTYMDGEIYRTTVWDRMLTTDERLQYFYSTYLQ